MAWNFADNKKLRVAVAIPHMGAWTAEFSDKVYGPLKYITIPEFDKKVIPCKGMPYDVARNTLAAEALADPQVTHIMWVDSDIVFEQPPDPNDAILQLLNCNAPIASGVYRAKQKQGFNYSMWMKHPEGFVPIIEWTGNWIEVSVVGFGCCLTKREVFEKIPEPWFLWDKKDGPSEDFYFCLKAAEYGYKVRVFTDIRCSHIGTLKVKTDGVITTLDV